MKYSLVPDFFFEHFYNIKPEFLISQGIKNLILDIDNTLEPYENDFPGDKVIMWLEDLRKQGIKCAFVSNNSKERVEIFNRDLKLPAFWKARKPFKSNVIRAMKILNAEKSNTATVGDQIFTDVWAARNAGVKAILVPPINDKKDMFTKAKRWLEKPFLKKYEKRNNK